MLCFPSRIFVLYCQSNTIFARSILGDLSYILYLIYEVLIQSVTFTDSCLGSFRIFEGT